MRFHAIAIFLLMMSASIAGCIADEGMSNDDVDDTVENIDGTSNEAVNQTTNDTADHETGNQSTNDTADHETTEGGNDPTNNTVQYLGFMDNSSIYGWEIHPIENLSRIYIAYSEENCTNKDHGDDWNGTSYSNSLCVKDLGQEWGPQGYSITHQNEELCVADSTENHCWNMTVSNRVMWLQGDIWGGQEEVCSVYIQSVQFVPSSSYHLALRAYDANGDYIHPDWDSLLNDPDYTIWNDERMDAYNNESSNAPAWCTDPQFGWIMPASQVDEDGGGSSNQDFATMQANAQDHSDDISTNSNDNLMELEVTLLQNIELQWSDLIITLDDDGDGTNQIICSNPGQSSTSDCIVTEIQGNGDGFFDVGEKVTISENGVDICSSNQCEKYVTIYGDSTRFADNQPYSKDQVFME